MGLLDTDDCCRGASLLHARASADRQASRHDGEFILTDGEPDALEAGVDVLELDRVEPARELDRDGVPVTLRLEAQRREMLGDRQQEAAGAADRGRGGLAELAVAAPGGPSLVFG
jgi:hypothetical protein